MKRRLNPFTRKASSGGQSKFRLSLESLEQRTLLAGDLVISEINYNPYAQAFDDVTDDSDKYEFIELHNTGDQTLNLAGTKFIRIVDIDGNSEGIDFVFGAESLAPDERVVIVEDLVAFQSRYGDQIPVAGEWSGGLGNGGEMLTLVDSADEIIVQMNYKSSGKWPGRANGIGATLEYPDPDLDPAELDQDDPDSWQSSVEFGGTPGRAPGDRTPDIIFNEILAHTDLPQIDIIELYNTTTEPVDVSGWFLTDNIKAPFGFSLPAGSVVPADGYLFFDESHFNPGAGTLPTDFALSERGEDLWLISSNENGRPAKFRDNVSFGATINGVSLGNIPNGNTSGDLQPLAKLSFGEPNGAHRVSDIVITEIQYHPVSDNVFHEFIEIQNTTVFSNVLDDWRIGDAVDVRVPKGTTIGAKETLVLVAFDPADEIFASDFRDYYHLENTVRLVGPWGTDNDGEPDTLSNTGEKITLNLPMIDTDLTPLFAAVDQVDYNDKAPWPEAADGDGASLGRLSPEMYGNDASSWQAITPSPGNQPFQLIKSAIDVSSKVDGELGRDGEAASGDADVDVYSFTPSASGSFSFDATGIEFDDPTDDPDLGLMKADTVVRVFNAAGDEIAFNDNQNAESTDSQVVVELIADEEYLVVVSGSSATPQAYDPFTGFGMTIGSVGPYSIEITPSEDPVDPTPWQNSANPLDVDKSGSVVPFDALLVINELNGRGPGALPVPPDSTPINFVDVTGDNILAPFDALLIINFLNSAPMAVAAIDASAVAGPTGELQLAEVAAQLDFNSNFAADETPKSSIAISAERASRELELQVVQVDSIFAGIQ